jgi:hypothetical protein
MALLSGKLSVPFPKLRVRYDHFHPTLCRFPQIVLAKSPIETPEKGDTAHVKAVFELLFRAYGLPRFIRSDNGPPFGNVFNLWGLSRLSVWFMSLGITIDLDDPVKSVTDVIGLYP